MCDTKAIVEAGGDLMDNLAHTCRKTLLCLIISRATSAKRRSGVMQESSGAGGGGVEGPCKPRSRPARVAGERHVLRGCRVSC